MLRVLLIGLATVALLASPVLSGDADIYQPPDAPSPPVIDLAEVTVGMQIELVRLGCSTSTADGNWGSSSRAALSKFAKYAKVTLAGSDPTPDMLDMLRSHSERVCPAPSKTTNTAPTKVSKPTSKPQKTQKPTTSKPTTTSPTKCFTYNGASFCE